MNRFRFFTAALVLVAVTSCGDGKEEIVTSHRSPLVGKSLYVDPERPVVVEHDKLQNLPRHKGDAELLDRIAVQPSAYWASGGSKDAAEIRRITHAAAQKGKLAMIVADNIPRSNCSDTTKDAADATAYRKWLESVASGIAGPSIVVVEPGAIAQIVKPYTHCALERWMVQERYALLQEAINAFKARGAIVYLDAANPFEFPDESELRPALQLAGVEKTHGIAVNVASFASTEQVIRWSQPLARALGDIGVIIDTSRNGNSSEELAKKSLCNTPDAALGEVPATNANEPLIDGKLWIYPPGVSDGACQPGQPERGTFWAPYAFKLVKNTMS